MPTTVSAQHFVPPTQRQLRSQASRRLQVGLIGLCAMLLLVSLANIIMTRTRSADLARPETAAEAAGASSDPLADIGVVPAADPSADANAAKPARAGRR